MPRARKIWRKAGRSYFYTKIDGVQTRLDKVEKGEAASQRVLEKSFVALTKRLPTLV